MREAFLERETRFELATPTLARLCSTTELFSLFHSSASAVKWTANLRNGCAWAKHSLENFFWFHFLGEIRHVNYLAHLVLGGADSDVRLGNFIGDSVKGNRLTDYPAPVAQGHSLSPVGGLFCRRTPGSASCTCGIATAFGPPRLCWR